MSYPEALRELVEAYELVDRSERISLLIDTAERFHEVDAAIAERPFDESHRVPHCESEAFVWAIPREDGRFDLHFAVDNPQGVSAKAMAVILSETLSGADPEEVLQVPEDVAYRIFGRELSMGKNMGLTAMIGLAQRQIRRQLPAVSGTSSPEAQSSKK